jgi:hypothetical protein
MQTSIRPGAAPANTADDVGYNKTGGSGRPLVKSYADFKREKESSSPARSSIKTPKVGANQGIWHSAEQSTMATSTASVGSKGQQHQRGQHHRHKQALNTAATMRNRQEQQKAGPIEPLMFTLIQLPHDHEQAGAGAKPAIPSSNKSTTGHATDGAQANKNRQKKKKGTAQWRWSSEQHGPYSAANSESGGQTDVATADNEQIKGEQAEGETSAEGGKWDNEGGRKKKRKNAKKKKKGKDGEDGEVREEEEDDDDDDDGEEGGESAIPQQLQQRKGGNGGKKRGTAANQPKCVQHFCVRDFLSLCYALQEL